MKTIDAYHLPMLEDRDIATWQECDFDGPAETRLHVRWPQLTPDGAARIAIRLRDARTALRARTVAQVISAIDQTVTDMRSDPAGWAELCAAVAAVTGYSLQMTQHVMARMSYDWNAQSLNRLIEAELGGAEAIDSFAVRGDKRVHASGPALSVHIFSGNVPGVAVTSIIRTLLLKAPVFGKAASGEPILAAAFARALHAVDPDIGNAVAVTYWEGGTDDIEAAVFEHADTIIHYGGHASLDDVRRRLPSHTTLIDHGPRISFGIVTREQLAGGGNKETETLIGDIARAVATFDQQGCVSPHMIYVEEGGDITPREMAARIASAFPEIQKELPPGRLTSADAAAIRRARDEAEFRGIAGEETDVHGPGDLGFTVIYDPRTAFTASCLNRTLIVHPVSHAEAIPRMIDPFRSVLQTAAVAAPGSRFDTLAADLADAGVSRVTTFAHLPWPAPDWHHDGRGPLTEMVRYTDVTYRAVVHISAP
jgi:hypothetical protein